MYSIFLDDERVPGKKYEHFVVLRSVKDAIEYVKKNGYPSFVTFDHDLGDGVPTGLDFAKWLIEEDLDNKWMAENGFAFEVHSMNPVGKRNIEMLLLQYLECR